MAPINPVITIHKVNQADTTGSVRTPVFEFFERMIATFTVPVVGATASIVVVDSTKYAVGQYVYIPGAGFFLISSIPSLTTIYVLNNGSTGTLAAGTTVAATTLIMTCPPPSSVPAAYTQHQAGQTVALTTTVAADAVLLHVDYPIAFAVAPSVVVLQIESDTNLGAIAGQVQLYVRNRDEAGFDIYATALGAFTFNVNWIAMA